MRELEKNIKETFNQKMKNLIYELVLKTSLLEDKEQYLIATNENKLCIIHEENYNTEFDENGEFLDGSNIGVFRLSNRVKYSTTYSLEDIAHQEYRIFLSYDGWYSDFEARQIENSLIEMKEEK